MVGVGGGASGGEGWRISWSRGSGDGVARDGDGAVGLDDGLVGAYAVDACERLGEQEHEKSGDTGVEPDGNPVEADLSEFGVDVNFGCRRSLA
ncbi:hypothetical protein [Nocardia testacea]|uniref:hypothetical protein n=1 Tax=Nocardia testacea TaxID=248551 RepID=UPI0012F6CC60|nr:hypothetical protein [Nocardia testacea]